MSRSPAFRTKRTQSGAALLIFALLLISTLLGMFLGHLNSNNTTLRERGPITTEALSQAKDALIGFAITYRDTHPEELTNMPVQPFGYFPRPDVGNSGESTACGNPAPPCENQDVSLIGRLPWKTLKLPPLRDEASECLWYAVSGRAKNNPKSPTFNWDTVSQFVVQDANGTPLIGTNPHDRPLAIVLAARAPLSGQTRTAPAASECGGTTVVGDYLEMLDANWLVANHTGDITLRLTNANSLQNSTNNDKGLWVSSRDIFDRIKKRSDFKEDIDVLMTDIADNYLNKLAPASIPLASAGNKGIDDVVANYLAANPSLSTRKALVLSNWQDNLLYAGGPSGSYTLNGSPTNCRALLFFSGERTNAQTRSTPTERANAAMYLDVGSNAATFPVNGAYSGVTQYSTAASSADIVRCINGLGAGQVSFNNPSDFSRLTPAGVGANPDTSSQSTPSITITEASGSSGGCLWFPDPIPLAGKTLRSYYEFQFTYPDSFVIDGQGSDRGNGFTFQMVRSDLGAPAGCGTESNLGALGSSDMWGSFSYIVETDVYQGSSDPSENHSAIMINGNLSHTSSGTMGTACNGSTSGCRHAPANTFEESPTPLAHRQRLEIHTGCNSNCTTCNPSSHSTPNTYARITTWVDCTDCSDVITDLDRTAETPTIQRCQAVYSPEMDSVYFGFTGGFRSGTPTGSAPAQGVRIRNFVLRSD